MKQLLFILLSFIMATAVFAQDKPLPRSNMVSADNTPSIPVFKDASKPITINHTQPNFMIELPANPTTGYSWFTVSYDSNLLNLVGQKYIAPEPAIPGKGGVTRWTFNVKPQALKAAFATKIILLYARPWEIQKGQQTAFVVVTQP